MNENTRLIDHDLLSRLDGLRIATHRPLPGLLKGELRSPKHGSAIEFADFRDYVPGDDLRNVDWNIYARLERPYIKLFEEEEEVAARILIDCSHSMNWGEPNKFDYARKLGGCLAYMALRNRSWVSVYGFSKGVQHSLARRRGPAFIPAMLQFLDRLAPENRTDLLAASRQIVSERNPAGLVFLISDLFDPNFDAALSILGSRTREVVIIHLLSPQEIEPDLSGDIRLIDSESGEAREASITPRLHAKYKDNLESWRTSLKRSCLKRGMDYVTVDSSTPLEELLLTTLRRRGILA